MIIFVFNLSLRFISRFGRFHEDFPLKEGTVRVPLPFSRNRLENHSHNLGKALGEGLGLLCAPFTSLSLSPLYPFHLSIPFTSLSLSPLYPFHLSLSLSISLISPSLSISLLLPFFLSLSFSLSSLYQSLWRILWTFSSFFIIIILFIPRSIQGPLQNRENANISWEQIFSSMYNVYFETRFVLFELKIFLYKTRTKVVHNNVSQGF